MPSSEFINTPNYIHIRAHLLYIKTVYYTHKNENSEDISQMITNYISVAINFPRQNAQDLNQILCKTSSLS